MVHQDTTVALKPLTVFVGPNGSGKSALFDALLNCSMVLSRRSVRQAFGPYPYSFDATLYQAAPNNSTIGYEIELSESSENEESLKYEIAYQQEPGRDDVAQFSITKEKITRLPAGSLMFDRQDAADYPISSGVKLSLECSLFSAIRHIVPNADIPDIAAKLAPDISRFNKFRLDPIALANPSRIPDVAMDPKAAPPRLGYHGEDLPSVLIFLADVEDPSYQIICDTVRSLIPEFENFEFSTVGTDRVAFSIKFSDGRGNVPAVRLSSGMLSFIGLITLVSSPSRPPVLMIEEPENGLTPQAIALFYTAVRKLAFAELPENRSQVLISSHSPFVICEAWNGEDRDFIHQVKVRNGKAEVKSFNTVIADQGILLGKVEGERKHMSLKTAEDVMSGRFSG